MPTGVSIAGSAASPNRSTFSMRASSSRTPVKYWSSLPLSPGSSRRCIARAWATNEIENRPLFAPPALEVRAVARRALRCRRGARRPAGDSFRASWASSASSTRGCTDRHRHNPSRTCLPGGWRRSPARATGTGSAGRSAARSTGRIETPARMSVALFFSRTPVKNVPLPRAWSPAPSGPPLAVR